MKARELGLSLFDELRIVIACYTKGARYLEPGSFATALVAGYGGSDTRSSSISDSVHVLHFSVQHITILQLEGLRSEDGALLAN